MTIHQNDLKLAKSLLWQNETVMATATQRRAGPGMNPVNPTTIIATDRRIIVVKRATFGLRKDIETIPYDRVTSIRVEKGFFSASLYLRVSGYTAPGAESGFMGKGEQEGEIDGMYKNDAKDIGDYLNKIVTGMIERGAPPTPEPQRGGIRIGDSPMEKPVYCPYCGSKNDPGSVFCDKCGKKIERIVR